MLLSWSWGRWLHNTCLFTTAQDDFSCTLYLITDHTKYNWLLSKAGVIYNSINFIHYLLVTPMTVTRHCPVRFLLYYNRGSRTYINGYFTLNRWESRSFSERLITFVCSREFICICWLYHVYFRINSFKNDRNVETYISD